MGLSSRSCFCLDAEKTTTIVAIQMVMPIDDDSVACKSSDWLQSERMRARRGPSWDAATKEDLSQDDGVVVSFIMCRKNECNPSFLSEGTQFVQPVPTPMYLFRVAASKLVPTSRIVSEPLPQRCARSNVLGPHIDRCICFSDAPGPQAVDQYSSAIARAGGIVCPF